MNRNNVERRHEPGLTRYFHSLSPQCLCPDWWMKSIHAWFDWMTGFAHEQFKMSSCEKNFVCFWWMKLFCRWTTLRVIMLGHIQSFNSTGGPLFCHVSDIHSNDSANVLQFLFVSRRQKTEATVKSSTFSSVMAIISIQLPLWVINAPRISPFFDRVLQ